MVISCIKLDMVLIPSILYMRQQTNKQAKQNKTPNTDIISNTDINRC